MYRLLASVLGGFPGWLTDLVATLLGIIALLTFAALMVMVLVFLERRVVARFQNRIGPNRVGPNGILQLVADTIKLITKEDIIPTPADRLVFVLAPLVVVLPTILVWAVIPFAPGASLADLNIGLLYFIAISSLTTMGILMAGWGSNNKYALLGGMRAVAMMISYELPLVLSVVGIVLLAGTLSIGGIIEAQRGVWFVLVQPLGFIIFIVCALAEANRVPFDLVEGESEIVAGYHIEYSGMRWALFFMAEYVQALAISALGAALFFGGWQPLPFLGFVPPWIWFGVKTFLVFFILIWSRATLPRIRVDQVLSLAWKGLLPLALANIFVAGIELEIYKNLIKPLFT
ncbi:MAG: NADH-quinone oxidoreductase subunit NuoH [Chloroflexi bacterium]|nr:NADH-quinone oxidoreductase subunit NuoH [Chloroflexota bacterium]